MGVCGAKASGRGTKGNAGVPFSLSSRLLFPSRSAPCALPGIVWRVICTAAVLVAHPAICFPQWCRLLLLDRIEAGRLAAQEREQREQVQAAPAAATAATAAASGQSQEPSLRNLPDAAQQVLPVVAAPADATATVAAAGVLGGNAILRRLQSTASSKSHQDAINLAVAAAAPQNGHIKHE